MNIDSILDTFVGLPEDVAALDALLSQVKHILTLAKLEEWTPWQICVEGEFIPDGKIDYISVENGMPKLTKAKDLTGVWDEYAVAYKTSYLTSDWIAFDDIWQPVADDVWVTDDRNDEGFGTWTQARDVDWANVSKYKIKYEL